MLFVSIQPLTTSQHQVNFNPRNTPYQNCKLGSSDKTVKVWDLESGKEKFSFDHGDGVTGLDWSWDGSLLATVSKDKKIRIIDPRANQITAVRFSL